MGALSKVAKEEAKKKKGQEKGILQEHRRNLLSLGRRAAAGPAGIAAALGGIALRNALQDEEQ